MARSLGRSAYSAHAHPDGGQTCKGRRMASLDRRVANRSRGRMPRMGRHPQPVRRDLSIPTQRRRRARSEAATPPRGRRHDQCNRQRGIALILVLWLTVLLTAIAGSFAYGMRTEALAARNTVSLAQARALADGAVN